MKNATSAPVIRLGDATDHGGVVTTADSTMKVDGKPVATQGCMTTCPKCKGVFPITSASGVLLHGKKTAHHGDTTACGAKLLSSL